MRVSRQEADASRERILEAAAKLFRERGLDGIGVADLMKSAGLTHGGFYGHFDSKEDLMAQACKRALENSLGRWNERAERLGGKALEAIVTAYLSPRHRDDPGRGCVVSALATDVPRAGGQVRRAFTDGFAALLAVLTRVVPGRNAAARREKALATFAALVGAIVLARAVDDRALSNEILEAVGEAVVRA